MELADFGMSEKPRADNALRMSGDVTNSLNGTPSQQHMRAMVAPKVRSKSGVTYLFKVPVTEFILEVECGNDEDDTRVVLLLPVALEPDSVSSGFRFS